MRTLIYMLTIGFFLTSAFNTNAQIGKIKNIKKEASKTTKDLGLGSNKKQTTKATSTTKSQSSTAVKSSSTSSSSSSSSGASSKDYQKLLYKKGGIYNELLKSGFSYGEERAQEYFNLAESLNYDSLETVLKENGKPESGGYSVAEHYKNLSDFDNKFTAYLEGDFTTYINQMIDNAYQDKNHNMPKALSYIKGAKIACDAAKILAPEKEIAVAADVETAYNDIVKKYEKKVFTSDFHRENAGKILFSDKPIKAGEEDPNQFKTEFTINDKIYAMAYLPCLLEDHSGKSGQYYVQWENAQYSNILFTHNECDLDKAFYPIEIIPAIDEATHAVDAKQFARIISGLSPRTHEINITLNGAMDVQGKLKINLAGMDAEKLKADAEEAVQKAEDNWARKQKLPAEFDESTYTYKTSELSVANIKAILKNSWDNCAEVTQVVIKKPYNNEEWELYKNDLGIPRYKASNAKVHVVYKSKDGWCYYVKGVYFEKEYEGAGNYGKAKLLSDGYHNKIDCSNL